MTHIKINGDHLKNELDRHVLNNIGGNNINTPILAEVYFGTYHVKVFASIIEMNMRTGLVICETLNCYIH